MNLAKLTLLILVYLSPPQLKDQDVSETLLKDLTFEPQWTFRGGRGIVESQNLTHIFVFKIHLLRGLHRPWVAAKKLFLTIGTS